MANKAPEIDDYLESTPSSFVIWMLAQNDLGPPLTDKGWEELMATLDAACRIKGQAAGKLLLQVFNNDPDTATHSDASSEQKPWIGLEFDYALEGDEVEVRAFNQFYAPHSDIPDPAFDPDLADHAQITIPYEALDLEVAETYMDYISCEYRSQQ